METPIGDAPATTAQPTTTAAGIAIDASEIDPASAACEGAMSRLVDVDIRILPFNLPFIVSNSGSCYGLMLITVWQDQGDFVSELLYLNQNKPLRL